MIFIKTIGLPNWNLNFQKKLLSAAENFASLIKTQFQNSSVPEFWKFRNQISEEIWNSLFVRCFSATAFTQLVEGSDPELFLTSSQCNFCFSRRSEPSFRFQKWLKPVRVRTDFDRDTTAVSTNRPSFSAWKVHWGNERNVGTTNLEVLRSSLFVQVNLETLSFHFQLGSCSSRLSEVRASVSELGRIWLFRKVVASAVFLV